MSFNDVRAEEIDRYTARTVCREISGGANGKKGSVLKKMDKMMLQMDKHEQEVNNLLDKLSTITEGTKDAYDIERRINKIKGLMGKEIEKYSSLANKFSNVPTKFTLKREVDKTGITYSQGEFGKEKHKVAMLETIVNQSREYEVKKLDDIIGQIKEAHLKKKINDIDEKNEQKIIEENERKGREEYNLGRELKEKVYNDKVAAKGYIDFQKSEAVKEYGNTEKAMKEAEKNSKQARKRLDEIEGRE